MFFKSFLLFSHFLCFQLCLSGQFSDSSRFFLFNSHLLFEDSPFFSGFLLCCLLCLLHFELLCSLQCLGSFPLCFELSLMCQCYSSCLLGGFSLTCKLDCSDAFIFFFGDTLLLKLSPLRFCLGEISNGFFCNQFVLLSFLGSLVSSNFV